MLYDGAAFQCRSRRGWANPALADSGIGIVALGAVVAATFSSNICRDVAWCKAVDRWGGLLLLIFGKRMGMPASSQARSDLFATAAMIR